ncbi:MAG: RsiV family protein [Clostridiales bacterium]|jgi:hypothetical protein|nr:RsiV family protein [Clostridiales bacterium]
MLYYNPDILINNLASSFIEAAANAEETVTYKTTYDKNGMMSFYRDKYTIDGKDAHGSTVRESFTFDLKNGKKLNLEYFINKQPRKNLKDTDGAYAAVKEKLIALAEQKSKETPGIYFDDYQRLIAQKFNPDNFYLTENGIVIYFQQYDIAPYSTGIVEFNIGR